MNWSRATVEHGKEPLVSVIIPAYEAAGHITHALDSVFAQTFRDYEVIVINDGSPDSLQLAEVLRPYAERIRYLQQQNQGPSGARNTGILHARGEVVAFLDSDDVWFPTYLEEQLRVLQGPPPLGLVYCNAVRVGPMAGRWRTCMDASPSNGPVTFQSLAREQCHVVTSCTVARRQAVIEAGLFDPAFRRSEDFDLWLRMAHRGVSMAYHRAVLAEHTLREEGLSGDASALLQGQIAVYRKLLTRLQLSVEESSVLNAEIERCDAIAALDRGKHYLLSGRYSAAATELARANTFYRRPQFRAIVLSLRVMPCAVRWLYRVSLNRKTASSSR